MSISLADIEKTASAIIQGISEHQTLINMIATSVGIMPEVALAEKALPMIAGILQFMQQESGKSLPDVFADLMSHLTPGQPNSPVLTAPAAGQNQEHE